MAPGPGGSSFVSIPTPDGVVVALFDGSGRPRPGWPIAVTGVTECGQLLSSQDGSARVVCVVVAPDGSASTSAAFAFGSNGRLLAGWPVALDGHALTARMVGEDLTLFASWSLVELDDGKPNRAFGIVTIASSGALRSGVRVPMFCCERGGTVGPDGIVHVLTDIASDGSEVVSELTALDDAGVRAGWPFNVNGLASAPAEMSGGRIVLTAGSPTKGTSEALVFDRDATTVGSAAVPIVTVTDSWSDTGGCPPSPQTPLVSQEGTIFIFSEADHDIIAIDPSLTMMGGWPYRPATPLVRRDSRYVKEDAYCPSLAIPAVGPDSTLYLPLQARNSNSGDSLVAVGPEGRVRAGWPVELNRPGSEFWSVVVGSDGTVFALAIEPESSRSSSATILAIAPDSTVLFTTTIVDR